MAPPPLCCPPPIPICCPPPIIGIDAPPAGCDCRRGIPLIDDDPPDVSAAPQRERFAMAHGSRVVVVGGGWWVVGERALLGSF